MKKKRKRFKISRKTGNLEVEKLDYTITFGGGDPNSLSGGKQKQFTPGNTTGFGLVPKGGCIKISGEALNHEIENKLDINKLETLSQRDQLVDKMTC